MPTRRRRAERARKSSPPKRTSPASGRSRPASTRKSVVFPEPEGPSRARNSLSAAARETSFSAGKRPKLLLTPRISSAFAASASGDGELLGESPFETRLDHQGDEAEPGQEGGGREGAHEVIV